jgi:putative heme transporter
MVIIVAIIMAIALDPAVRKLQRARLSRSVGAVVIVLLVTLTLCAMVAASWMTLRDQSRLIVQRLSASAQEVREAFPIVEHILPSGQSGDGLSTYAIGIVRSSAAAISMIVLALALTVYFLIEWKPTLEWILAFVPERHRAKARRTLDESRDIVFRYAVGNTLSSAITGVVTYFVLMGLGVPAALMLAVISAVLNYIPVIGFILSAVLAALLAATVSTPILLAVVAFYIGYNILDSYLISPKIYGSEMQLSKLAVLIAVIVGAQLGGIMGSILALPIAAIYPTIERIWLRERLGTDTVEIHSRLSA